ncbi:hypothetical protein [Telmatospirillum sp. J64-1]|uniref:ferritin family protein n=1 Tax=Telmatospirillum sp. J64-1 TaxID=2502183 RepID=UPI00351B228D
MMEELEAADWYRQRADDCDDDHLRDILLHNMREEIEHAAMVLEWLRRNDADFDEQLRTYLFTESNVVDVEEEEEGKGEGGAKPQKPNGFTIGKLPGSPLSRRK